MPIDPKISELFDNLDWWRHLPNYQLERRVDIFFSLYLPRLLETKYHRPCRMLIPEFPIHVPTIYPKERGNLSYKVDYLGVLDDPKKENNVGIYDKPGGLVFIELKTTIASRRDKQDRYLALAQEKGMGPLIRGLSRICKATASLEKYEALTGMLKLAGIVVVEDRGRFKPVPNLPRPEILYIQPTNEKLDERVLTFMEIYEQLTNLGDAMSERFAQSLREWIPINSEGRE
jgi:hypothetical protein